jgi:hypothetical protein
MQGQGQRQQLPEPAQRVLRAAIQRADAAPVNTVVSARGDNAWDNAWNNWDQWDEGDWGNGVDAPWEN